MNNLKLNNNIDKTFFINKSQVFIILDIRFLYFKYFDRLDMIKNILQDIYNINYFLFIKINYSIINYCIITINCY